MEKHVITEYVPGPVSQAQPVASPREQLVQQIASGNGNENGGIFSQLFNNPFFTAVYPQFPRHHKYMD